MSFRFHVEASGGRRSGEWTVKIGGSNDADVYLAPRTMMANIKVSLHESGECRIGPTERLRERISWRFRAAQTTWFRDRRDPNPTPILAVVFRHDQLVSVGTPPHPDSHQLAIGDGEELWVVLSVLTKEAAATANYEGMSSVTQIPLGDGTILDLHSWRRTAEDSWLDELAAFNPVHAAEYPETLSGHEFGYAIGETKERPFPIILEVAGTTVEAQALEPVIEQADKMTSEEFVMDRLTKAKTDLDAVIPDLFGRGPLWDGAHLGEPATAIANILSTTMEALATLDRIAHVDGADPSTGLPDESELLGWLDLSRRLVGNPCDDPNCPDHTVGRSRGDEHQEERLGH
jgi:hypothetical protein